MKYGSATLCALVVLGCAPALWPTYADVTAAPVQEVTDCVQGSVGRLGYLVSGSDTVANRVHAEREDVSRAARDSAGIRRFDVLEATITPRAPEAGSRLAVQVRAYSIHPGPQGAVQVDEMASEPARIDARRVMDECAAIRGVPASSPSPSRY